MLLSTPNPRFLLDENVRTGLAQFLKANGFDVASASKSAPDSQLAEISKKEQRILITNDSDFEEYTRNQIHAVILLKIPQNDEESLVSSFKRLITKNENLLGKLVVLKKDGEDVFPLAVEFKV